MGIIACSEKFFIDLNKINIPIVRRRK